MCGLFGLVGHEQASRMAYFGLYAQQHRGQESAGIVSWSAERMHAVVGMGLVPEVFSEDSLPRLPGDTAIGHVRSSVAGVSAPCNAQPLVVRVRGMEIALAHSGNLTNAAALRRELEGRGAIFQTTGDSEMFLHLLAHALQGQTLEEAIIATCARMEGAYSLVLLAQGRLYALRDPRGMRPLALGRANGGAWVVASETCAFDLLEAEFVRSLEPGELAVIDGKRLTSHRLAPKGAVPVRQCIFELVYFARPDSIVFDEDVYQCRKRMGAALARESATPADFAMPFPDSGVYATVGFAQAAGIPYEHALIRNHYVGRTFIQPTQSMRQFSVRVKINPVRSMIAGKSLCIVDDSIVRGTTVQTRAAKLRELGAREIHFRVSCPPVRFPCCYGIDFADPSQLVAVQHPVAALPGLLGLDSLHFLSESGLLSAVGHPDQYCLACFNGDYPTAVERE
ncbi:MAG: amidophosphoribosyltransferase [Deltaproteobacteria bacterium]|jgi:amidophosphoribosyltransferase|nr:amidophosphoribosyltransferase [Deltaproteobacteria bacterium]